MRIIFLSHLNNICERDYEIRVHILGHKTRLKKFKGQKLWSIFFKLGSKRSETSYKKKDAKNSSTWRVKNMLLNKQGMSEES